MKKYWWLLNWGLFLLHEVRSVAATACLTTLNELEQMEKTVVDYNMRRTYTLCPNTRFVVGKYDYSYHLINGQDPLVIRPNLHVKCGDSGSRSNQCLLLAGDVLVRDVPMTTEDSTSHSGPIILEGLTLIDPGRHFAKFQQPHMVHFVDCEFREAQRAWVPFLMDFYDPNMPQKQLSVYWHGCDFVENSYRGFLAQPSLIVGSNLQVALSLRGCRFTKNDFVTNNTIVSGNLTRPNLILI